MTSIRDHKSDGSQELSLEIQKANYFATAAKENWISMVSFAVFILVRIFSTVVFFRIAISTVVVYTCRHGT